MIRASCISVLGFATALTACATAPRARPATAAPSVAVDAPSKATAWLAIASPEDATRLQRLPEAWASGLQETRAGRFGAALKEEAALLRPDAALPRPAPTPGSYYCRLVRLGKTGPKAPAFERFKPFFCYVEVEDELLTIVKQTGSERPGGRLWEDDVPTRLVFLGSVAREREQLKAYGDDATRDMAGVMERYAPMRWRLLLPFPRTGGKLDIYELTPVPEQPKS